MAVTCSSNPANSLPAIRQLVSDGAIFYVSHSGGKDSMAMYAIVRRLVPDDQIVVVHANLGKVEWPGVIDHIKGAIRHPLNIVSASIDLLDLVRRRGRWPSPKFRYCTSDLKRQPIEKFIRADMKARGARLAVDCQGLRAEESPNRASKDTLVVRQSLTTRTRMVYTWLPIHSASESEVFNIIAQDGQKPHFAYKRNKRLSCVFCIMGSKGDLLHGAEMNPTLLDEYAQVEVQTSHSIFFHKGQPIPIKEYIGVQNDTVQKVAV